MGRTSSRVGNYVSARGQMKQMSISDIYYKTVELRTVLCDIARNHKRWGNEWYRLITLSKFESAKTAVLVNGSGDMVVDTICFIDELADLETRLVDMERGE